MRRFGKGWGGSVTLTFCLILVWSLAPKAVTAKEPYKVGAVFAVTGGASILGEPEKRTAEMLAEEINKKGGIDGHKLELVLYDDESDETKCRTRVTRLIKTDKVPVIIGPSTSGNTMAVIAVCDESKVPLISCASSIKIVTPVSERKWIFKVAPSDSHSVERIYEFLLKKGIKKVAIMTVSDGYGSSGREELLRVAPNVGIEVVADERYGPKDTDLTAQLTRIRGTGAQAVINWSVGPTQILAVKNWKELGMTAMTFVQSHGFASKKNIELAGGAAEGVFCPLGRVNIPDLLPATDPQKKVIMAYNEAYQGRFKEPLSAFGGHAWDALQLAVEALAAVGPDPAKIRDYLENRKNFVGQGGVFNFSPADHCGLTKDSFEMVVVKNGTWALAQ
ncbi:MAG: Extracellular ligand-binding receptor [Deltaproteobacteria bacterium]|nr:Extracellular ligand-binding receptor [Deltaproteobacteria bacterium]